MKGELTKVSSQVVLFVSLVVILNACGSGGGEGASPVHLELRLAQTDLPSATVGSPYNQAVALTASGGTPPYRYSCSVPGGTGLSATVSSADPTAGGVSCLIGGSPLSTGTVTISFSLMDSSNASASPLSLSIIIRPPGDSLANWHLRYSAPQGYNLRGVAYGKGIFVAVGDGGRVLASPDGITWISSDSGTSADLWSVRYGNGSFVATGMAGTLITSSDGLHWASQSTAESTAWHDVVYAKGLFVVVGEGPTHRPLVRTSPDGLSWSEIDVNTSATYGTLTGITYGNNSFVTVGVPGIILTSPDGANWTEHLVNTAMILSGIVYGNGTFVAVGTFMGKAAPIILASPDGVNWQRVDNTLNNLMSLQDISYGGGYFVGVGFLPDGSILTSADGTIWTFRPIEANPGFYGVAYGGGVFTAVGPNGTILQSDPIQ